MWKDRHSPKQAMNPTPDPWKSETHEDTPTQSVSYRSRSSCQHDALGFLTVLLASHTPNPQSIHSSPCSNRGFVPTGLKNPYINPKPLLLASICSFAKSSFAVLQGSRRFSICVGPFVGFILLYSRGVMGLKLLSEAGQSTTGCWQHQ